MSLGDPSHNAYIQRCPGTNINRLQQANIGEGAEIRVDRTDRDIRHLIRVFLYNHNILESHGTRAPRAFVQFSKQSHGNNYET